MNDCLDVYIKRDVTCKINNENIMQRFQNIKYHIKQLQNFMYFSFFIFIFFILYNLCLLLTFLKNSPTTATVKN